MGVLDHIQIALLCPGGGAVLFDAAVADRNDQIAALFLLQEAGIYLCHLRTVHPGQIRVFAVAIGLSAFQRKQAHLVAAHPADGVVFGTGFSICTGTKSVGAQVIGTNVRLGVSDLLAVGIVFDEHIGDKQLGQLVVDPIVQPVFPGVDPRGFNRLIAHVKFVVAQRASIVVHAVHQAYLDLAVEEGEERRPLTEIAAVEE